MDLLLENKMYEDVVSVFSQVQERNIKGAKYPKNCFVLAATALYRMVRGDSNFKHYSGNQLKNI